MPTLPALQHRRSNRDIAADKAPGPTYMTEKQMVGYLSNLRSSQTARPGGARPPPLSTRRSRMGMTADLEAQKGGTTEQINGAPPLGEGAIAPGSSARDDSKYTIPYYERGQRWTEKQEAKSLTTALRDMDVKEETRIQAAAQEEASRLVMQHQQRRRRSSVRRSREYTQHLRKGSHALSQAVGPFEPLNVAKGGNATVGSVSSRSASGGSNCSNSSSGRSSGSSARRRGLGRLSMSGSIGKARLASVSSRNSGKFFSLRGGLRKPSEQPDAMVDRNCDSAPPIVGPPPKEATPKLAAAPENKNSSLRKPASLALGPSAVRGSLAKRRLPWLAQQFPPTPPDSAANTESESDQPPNRDSLEIRSADIVAATSGPRSRSPNLPAPQIISGRADRPIVSFKTDYKPRADERVKVQADGVGRVEACRRSGENDRSVQQVGASREGAEAAAPKESIWPERTSSTQPRPVPSASERRQLGGSHAAPAITISTEAPPARAPAARAPEVPSIIAPAVPAIAVSDAPSINIMTVPSIVTPDEPPTRCASIPTISVGNAPIMVTPDAPSPTKRPLPRPGATAQPMHASSSSDRWSLASVPPTPRERARCPACGLAIAGRTLQAAACAFHPACFACHHCRTALEHVAFFLEPSAARSTRLNAPAFDGDATPRFYCHLDFHELFSPRCKSCKTPIEGEVVLACGAEWHKGHFFCAECGDPFERGTPFVEKEGYAWCVECHTKRFSGKCARCRRPITELVLQALGREWHEGCFGCTVRLPRRKRAEGCGMEMLTGGQECGAGFDDGKFFTRDGGSDPFCVACEERRLKA